MSLLQELFEEYTEWYKSLACENGVLPRSISGVDADGCQFIYPLDILELHHMARNKYIRFVLNVHNAIAYAYGGLALRGDSDIGEIEEVLDVVAADAKHYIMGHWRVVRDEEGKIVGLEHMGTGKGDDPENHPASWFLSGAIRFNESEIIKYGDIWAAAKPYVTFIGREADE
ncbi:MAG: hypothetical protein HGA26_09115 [Chlorobiaceae bacterium]|nr:hypothetical protein [Chlorobiaceae bacterium]